MDETGSVKAPMTRLRRRLSVEAPDDTKSPAGTPTKKRGAKLAAKPQLDLIEENAIQNSPKRATRKSLAKELVDTTAEKPVTPSRRSTRIMSNTSLVSEPTQTCESPRAKRAVTRRNSQLGSDTESTNTPARTRRTRKDSASSIDKIIVHTPVTPSRSKRTKKEYTSAADEDVESKNLLTEVITEEPELQDNRNETTTDKISSPNSVRKSPRLVKKDRRSTSSQPDTESNEKVDSTDLPNETQNKTMVEQDDNIDRKPKNNSKKDKLSISSENLIKELNDKPNKSSFLNKSSSAAELINNSLSKRQRTKSWSTLTVPASDNPNFFSDNEGTKKKKKDTRHTKGSGDSVLNISVGNTSLSKSKDENAIEISEFSAMKKKNHNEITLKGSCVTPNNSLITDESKLVNTSNESNKENKVKKSGKNDIDLLFQMKPTDVQSMVLVDDSDSNTDSIKQIETGDQCVPVVDPHLNKDDHTESKMNRKSDVHKNIFNVFQTETTSANDSVEPMEIDETITNSLILNESIVTQSLPNLKENDYTKANDSINRSRRKTSISNKTQEQLILQEIRGKVNKSGRKSPLTESVLPEESIAVMNKSKRKSSLDTQSNSSIANLNNSKSRKSVSSVSGIEEPNLSVNKSKRNSKSSFSLSHELEKSGDESKSTLVLSQINNISMGNNDSKLIQDKSASDSKVLSKSMTMIDNKKNSNNLKISNDYTTSTPVQDKNVKKLAMQMNTSVITSSATNKTKKKTSAHSKIESILSEDTNSSDEEDESKSKNSLVIDEAEDAGDDYQSGDSQDEEKRQYEEDNEIVEKGETLESEQDFTNESDYERDSFVVSSDEDDNELLSGSGDDLDMSDNELKMSTKSKKKFDEKAKKIQKKASREMFEARHNLDQSGTGTKKQSSNEKNRLRLDSTQSSDEMQVRKKNKRMRLDTYDSSNGDQPITNYTGDPRQIPDSMSQKLENTFNESVIDEIGRKKKKSKRLSESICESEPGDDVTDSVNTSKNKTKTKRLSESVCDQSVLKEQEITVTTHNEIEENKEDPLLVNVKLEPKTPQKYLDISTVNITCREDVEQVHINENTSMIKPNDTIDPLQTTIAENVDGDSDVSSISENEDITKNYDSVLNELNKESSKKIKTNDISLDNNKKCKKKNDTIIEHLNITQPKDKKTHKTIDEKAKLKNKITDLYEDSSDSINLKLLFSDDSSDCTSISNKETCAAESFIPLKRTEGKTNIRESISTEETFKHDSLLNTSAKSRNKNRKSSQTENVSEPNLTKGEPLNFFIDTEGEHSKPNNDLLNTSSKKKQKLSTSITVDNNIFKENVSDDDDAPTEVSFMFEKSNTRNKKNSESKDSSCNEKSNSSLVKTPKSEKKKNKSLIQKETQDFKGDTGTPDKPNDKKRKRSISADKETNNLTLNESQSKNKKKKLNISQEDPKQKNAEETAKRSKKRKEREDDVVNQKSKIAKEDLSNKKHVPRLPASILNELADKPSTEILELKKSKLISTCDFLVEDTKVKRKNKPSNYLEESVYLNDNPTSTVGKKKAAVKRPKVLPFMPTVSTSDSGFTTKFQVNVLPQKIEFLARVNPEVTNFKSTFLQDRKIKKLRTYDLFKQNRHIKLSKY